MGAKVDYTKSGEKQEFPPREKLNILLQLLGSGQHCACSVLSKVPQIWCPSLVHTSPCTFMNTSLVLLCHTPSGTQIHLLAECTITRLCWVVA